MKKLLITGAKGQLGIALMQLLEDKSEYEILLSDAAVPEGERIISLDITKETQVRKLIEQFQPDIIINCAAMTAVDLCESEQEKAYQINALGPKYIAMAAEEIGAKLIHISSDYVYDGKATKPYVEEDSENPASVYGRTKLAGDRYVLENCKKAFILRTAWVYGEGKNFVRTMLRLAEHNNKIRVVSDQYGSPTSALELARVILYLMETEGYGKYHATCEGSTNWYEFACEIFRQADKKVEVEAITSSEFAAPAPRPMYSVLDNKALRERHGYKMKHWMEAFTEYMRNELSKKNL